MKKRNTMAWERANFSLVSVLVDRLKRRWTTGANISEAERNVRIQMVLVSSSSYGTCLTSSIFSVCFCFISLEISRMV